MREQLVYLAFQCAPCGLVVDERGKSKGIEVREVAVRCGRGNRKVRCGGTRSF